MSCIELIAGSCTVEELFEDFCFWSKLWLMFFSFWAIPAVFLLPIHSRLRYLFLSVSCWPPPMLPWLMLSHEVWKTETHRGIKSGALSFCGFMCFTILPKCCFASHVQMCVRVFSQQYFYIFCKTPPPPLHPTPTSPPRSLSKTKKFNWSTFARKRNWPKSELPRGGGQE